MLGGAYFQIYRNGGYGKRNISFRAFPYPPFNVRFFIFPTNSVKPLYRVFHVPALLEQLNIPYTGAGPQCLAFCYDKSIIRGVAREMRIPVAKGMLVTEDSELSKLSLSFPLLVKPNSGDSSFGITQKSIAYSREELLEILAATREKMGSCRPFLLEEFLPGKDISVGIIGNLPSCFILTFSSSKNLKAS